MGKGTVIFVPKKAYRAVLDYPVERTNGVLAMLGVLTVGAFGITLLVVANPNAMTASVLVPLFFGIGILSFIATGIGMRHGRKKDEVAKATFRQLNITAGTTITSNPLLKADVLLIPDEDWTLTER